MRGYRWHRPSPGVRFKPFPCHSLIMDELTKGIQDELPWCMLFTDDIVLIDEIREGVNAKLERWKHALESTSFRVSRSKTEYMHCGFNGREEAGGEVTIDRLSIPKVEEFKYLGSIVQQNGEIDGDITAHKSGLAKMEAGHRCTL